MWTNEWFDKNYMNVEFVNDKKTKQNTKRLFYYLA